MSFWDRVYTILDSPRFFYGVLMLFIAQALWIVLSAAYPMAFDEDFHIGIIAIYAGQWLPFLSEHPAGADVYGAVARDPSYLFHYLMSFPYRVGMALFDSQTATIIMLRLLDIGFFAYALVVWRKVLRLMGLSAAASHVLLLLFVLIPIVPLLAAQVNYDNVLMISAAWMCLLAGRIITEMRLGRIPVVWLTVLLLIGLFTSLVKYAFLPIFVALAGGVVLYAIWRAAHRRLELWPEIMQSMHTIKRPMKITLVVLVVLAGGLFFERYGINMIRYGDPIPDCGAVLSVEQCSAYGPWGRDYRLAQQKGDVDTNPLAYAQSWVYGMWYRLFFVVNGNLPVARYQTFPPLQPLGSAGIIAAAVGLAAILIAYRRIIRRPLLLLLIGMSGLYVIVLWFQNYQMFLHTGEEVAINGRYLLLVIVPLAAVAIIAIKYLMPNRRPLKLLLTALLIGIFVLQGGLLSFITRSNDAWYWPHPTVRSVNHQAQRFIEPIRPKTERWLPQP